ncbi:integrase family protein [Roseateles sp.]|uniref:tyrosine-type recombinase/integrase n=1 Tax=Roseateles sp. TaxID=1971397 RepID=UPI0031DC844C
MARPSKSSPLDLTQPAELTTGVIDRLICPTGKTQAFLRDTKAPGLRVRVTAAGAKSFVFEAKVNQRNMRRTIGDVRSWTIDEARIEARRLAVLKDAGTDPRDLDRKTQADRKARAAEDAANALTVGQAWGRYLADRRPHWGDRNYADHAKMTQSGGAPRKRMPGVVTKPGPLAPLMALRLVDLTPQAVEQWAVREAVERPARVRLALRLLKAFLRWAEEEQDLRGRVHVAAANARKAKEAAGRPGAKDDVLQRGQLAAWFEQVQSIPNATISAYLQTLLLVGARPGEVLTLKWEDVDLLWKSLTIRDKVEGERVIPLTPYVERLLASLPKRNGWVFASLRAVSMEDHHVQRRGRRRAAAGLPAEVDPLVDRSVSGHISEPRAAHSRACMAAGIDGLTLHGLRRSFSSLTEWLEIPAGVVAQIQGHKPSATAEKHYKRRPLDLLRVHHVKIEAWILEQAGIEIEEHAVQHGPRLATGAPA